MIKRVIKHRFFTASFWVFFGLGTTNIGSYLYHLITARLLGPELYGVLEATISFLYFLAIPLLTLSLVIVKFTSEYKGKNDLKKLSLFYYYVQSRLHLFGIITGILLLLSSYWIMSFLHLKSYILFLMLIITFLIGLYTNLMRSALQGLSNFFGYSMSTTGEAVLKVVIAVFLILLGLKVEGAFAAIVISGIGGYFIGYYFMRKLPASPSYFTEKKRIARFALPVFLNTLAMTSLYVTDVLLVRHFFPGVESGYYAALSVLGKIIFFAVSPISLVMFPFVSEHHARGERYFHYLFFSLVLTVVVSASIIVLYFAIPDFMVLVLFGKKFLAIAPLVGIFGVFIGLYSITSLLANFFLSIHKTNAGFISLSGAFLQLILILIFHKSLLQVIEMSIISTFLLLAVLLLYYLHAIKKV